MTLVRTISYAYYKKTLPVFKFSLKQNVFNYFYIEHTDDISGFGPVKETDDSRQFMQYMEDLMALGGGDEPEMCLSALQVTITPEDI